MSRTIRQVRYKRTGEIEVTERNSTPDEDQEELDISTIRDFQNIRTPTLKQVSNYLKASYRLRSVP